MLSGHGRAIDKKLMPLTTRAPQTCPYYKNYTWEASTLNDHHWFRESKRTAPWKEKFLAWSPFPVLTAFKAVFARLEFP